MWWPKIDVDVEQVCKACEACQMERVRAGKDYFAGPFRGHNDDDSRCLLEVAGGVLNLSQPYNITSRATITRPRRLSRLHPKMRQNGILRSPSAHGRPASNGLAKRYVQTLKSGMTLDRPQWISRMRSLWSTAVLQIPQQASRLQTRF